MTNLAKRFATGFVGVPLIVGAVLYSQQSFAFLLFVIAYLGLQEFYKHCSGNGIAPQVRQAIVIAIFVFLPLIINDENLFPVRVTLPALIILFPLFFIRELFRKSENPFANIAFTFLGLIYLVLPLLLFYKSSFRMNGDVSEYHPHIILGYFIMLWAGDTGAYFVGVNFGKHKLFERHSPKKTWEGFAGGMLASFAAAFILSKYFSEFSLQQWMIISLIIIVAGTFGDLVESMFKRSVHLKDSGSILPGHGGFLDRFDALFISAPFVYAYIKFFLLKEF